MKIKVQHQFLNFCFVNRTQFFTHGETDLNTKNKAGKTVINLFTEARVAHVDQSELEEKTEQLRQYLTFEKR